MTPNDIPTPTLPGDRAASVDRHSGRGATPSDDPANSALPSKVSGKNRGNGAGQEPLGSGVSQAPTDFAGSLDGSAVRAGGSNPQGLGERPDDTRAPSGREPSRTTAAIDAPFYRGLYEMTKESIEQAFDGEHGDERDEPDEFHRERDIEIGDSWR